MTDAPVAADAPKSSSAPKNRKKRNRNGIIIAVAAIVLAFTFPYWAQGDSVFGFSSPLDTIFVDKLGITSDTLFVMAVYVMLALGLNIVVGFAGLLDLGYVAFFALGAYTVGWFASGLFNNRNVHFLDTAARRFPASTSSFWVVLRLAGLVCAIAGIIIGWPTLRLRGDYLAIVTLGFGEIIPDVFRNADAFPVPQGLQGAPPFLDFQSENLTNGVRGITQLDRPGFGHALSDCDRRVPARPLHVAAERAQALVLDDPDHDPGHDLREPAPARLEDGSRVDRGARGRDRRVGDGRPAHADEALGLRDRRRLRRLRRRPATARSSTGSSRRASPSRSPSSCSSWSSSAAWGTSTA